MNTKIKEYIENLEKELKELKVVVNPNGSVSGSSPSLIEMNTERAKEITSQLKGFRDALKIIGEEE